MSENSLLDSILLGLGGIYGYMVGLNYKVFFVFALLMLIDIIVGVLFSIINGEFRSQNMKHGLILKMLLMLLLLSLTLFQIILDDYGIQVPFANMVAGILAFMEMSSILETFAENDVIIPKKITKWFAVTKKELLSNEEDIEEE